MRGVPAFAANPRDASRLLRFLVDVPNTAPENRPQLASCARVRAAGYDYAPPVLDVADQILARADGVPLFIEELRKQCASGRRWTIRLEGPLAYSTNSTHST